MAIATQILPTETIRRSQLRSKQPHTNQPKLRSLTAIQADICPKPIQKRPAEKKVKPANLAVVEDQLLHKAINRHPNAERAITHLLSDVERAVLMEGPATRVMPPAGHAHLDKMEDLLFEALMRTHPNQGRALDRLLGDVVGDAADIDEDVTDEETERAIADMSFDRDCDGMA